MPAAVLIRSPGRRGRSSQGDDGTGPHKASHTAVAISGAEEPLGQLRVRASAAQAERLLDWAAAWPARTWAVGKEPAAWAACWPSRYKAGERVLDVQPKLGARVRLLATGNVNKNDPNDAPGRWPWRRCAHPRSARPGPTITPRC